MTSRLFALPGVSLLLIALVVPAVASARSKVVPKKPAPPAVAPKAAPAADDGAAMHKTLKRTIGAIRYKRSAKALAQFDGPAQGAYLAGAYWAKASPAEQTEFVTLFHKMFAGVAFPNIQKNFTNLETVLYSRPKVSGRTATVDAVIVILHPLKKQEIQTTFAMTKAADAWKVVDVTVKGNPSMLKRIRDEQVQKILAKGGFPKLLSLLRARVAKIK